MRKRIAKIVTLLMFMGFLISVTDNSTEVRASLVENHSLVIGCPNFLLELPQRVTVEELEVVVVKESPEEKPKKTHSNTYTDEEYNTFVHLLYAEAGGESDTCIYYVGSVVLNRVKSKKFPNTLMEVIYQKGQYSPTWHGFMSKKVHNKRCYEIAKDLLENGSVLPKDVLGQADYSIFKRYGSKLYAKVDNEYFFYLK